jgi:helicase
MSRDQNKNDEPTPTYTEEPQLPDFLTQHLRSLFNVETLFPPQAEALKTGVLEGESLVLSSPTASGKTLVAECAILNRIRNTGGKALYIVPLRALAGEKYNEFKRIFTSKLGLKVAVSTGDMDSADHWLEGYDIVVATVEKLDSLVRHGATWLRRVQILVLDEVHLINDPKRGPTLEVVTARLREINPSIQIVALSATISNADEIAKWLNAKLVTSDFRPVPLREGVALPSAGNITFSDGGSCTICDASIPQNRADGLSPIVTDVINNGGQLLIFTSTRRAAVTEAKRLLATVKPLLKEEDTRKLRSLSTLVTRTGEFTRISEDLSKIVEGGVAYHHAGLNPTHRRLIEENFRANVIKVICATATLAAGLNFPARVVVVRDYKRFSTLGNQWIPVLEYKQMAGRAGRPRFDKMGIALLMAKSEPERSNLLSTYCKGSPEKVYSKFGSESVLRTHILSTIATTPGVSASEGTTVSDIKSFISKTFYATQQENLDVVYQRLLSVLSQLESSGMITQITRGGDGENECYQATAFGKRVSQLCIDPLSAVTIRDGLLRAAKKDLHKYDTPLLHLISSTLDMPCLYLERRDYSQLQRFVDESRNEFLVDIPSGPVEYEEFLSTCKTAAALKYWVEEASEDTIIEAFDIGPGDLMRIADNCDWLLYAAYELSKALMNTGHEIPLHIPMKLWLLRQKVASGVREELLELAALKGVGRLRARMLYQAGFTSLQKLHDDGTLESLRTVPTIGERTATKLIEQVQPA